MAARSNKKNGRSGPIAQSKAATRVKATPFKKTAESFHIKLKHVLGGVSLLSLLAAFEVFSIPAANGIIDVLGFSQIMAGATWMGTALLSGGIALYLHEEEKG